MLPLLSRAAGTGNSPPARNFAVSPDTAVRFGSASVWMRPTCSSAPSVARRLFGEQLQTPPGVTAWNGLRTVLGVAPAAVHTMPACAPVRSLRARPVRPKAGADGATVGPPA